MPDEFDISGAVDGIASELGFTDAKSDDTSSDDGSSNAGAEAEGQGNTPSFANQPPADPSAPAPTPRAAPKSWGKEHHERWSKLDKDTQDYIELREKQFLDGTEQYRGDAGYAKELRETLTPYAALLKAQGLTEKQAVSYLMNAHYRMTQGSPEDRFAAYQQLGRGLGLVKPDAAAAGNQTPSDPAYRELQSRLNALESDRKAQAQAAQQRAQAEASKQIEAFASDPANVHFNEVGHDMVNFVSQGMELSDAYQRAVWANPITRQKELARLQTEAAEKLKAEQKAKADAARKASSTAVRGVDARTAPTEPKGKFLDTASMLNDLKEIQQRAN